MDGVQSFGEKRAFWRTIGQLRRSGVRGSNEKSLLLLGLIACEFTRRIRGIEQYGGESVSQSSLKDQAFSTFLDQNPPFELPPENGISPSTKACPVQWTVIDYSATKRLAKRQIAYSRSHSLTKGRIRRADLSFCDRFKSGRRNTRFLRPVEQEIPRLVA